MRLRQSFILLAGLVVMAGGFSAPSVLAQIPNPGFEAWTGGNPDGWFVNNLPPLAVPIVQSATANSGSSALQGTVGTFGTDPYPPFAWTVFPYTGRPEKLNGFLRMVSILGDEFEILAVLYNNNLPIAGAETSFVGRSDQYERFELRLEYFTGESPDSAYIWFTVVGPDGGDPHPGSSILVDDLAFSGVASSVAGAAGLPGRIALHANYPNPFNPSTALRFDLPQAGPVRLSVFDLLGREVAVLVDRDMSAGTHEVRFDAVAMSSGMYIARLRAGGVVITQRMMLSK